MKQRIITGVVGVGILFTVCFFYQTYFYNLAWGLIAAVGVFELLRATGNLQYKLLSIPSILYTVCFMFFMTSKSAHFTFYGMVVYMLYLFIILLIKHREMSVMNIAATFFFTKLLCYGFLPLVLIRNRFPQHALILLLFTFAGAWMSDTGAYFVGVFFGKHKMTEISPKKTWEGFFGGILSCLLSMLLFGFLYKLYCDASGIAVAINFVGLGLYAIVASVVSVLGDLSASIIKREYGIKDYGNIMPGHGGVMDRFDSLIFVAPVAFAIFNLFPIIV